MTFNLLGIINEDIGPSSSYVWIATGYTLAASVGALIWGRLSDVFGRRWFFIGGNALALLGSILGAAAQNIVTLIFAQVFIGLALPSQLSFSIALAELIPYKWRGYNNALLFFMAIPFSTFGPIIARNFITTSQGWRWSYYVNLILTGLAITLAFTFYHPPIFEQLHTRASKRKVLRDLDYIGILLFVAGLVLFLIGLSWGGQIYPWATAHTLCTLLIGLALIVGFFMWGESDVVKFGTDSERLINEYGRTLRCQRSNAATKLSKEPAFWRPHNGCWCSFCSVLPTECVLAAADLHSVGNGSASHWLAVMYPGRRNLSWTSFRRSPDQPWQSEMAARWSDYYNDCFHWRYVWLAILLKFVTDFSTGMASTNRNTLPTAEALCFLGAFSLGYVENVCNTLVPFTQKEKDIGASIGALISGRTTIATLALAIYSTVQNNKIAEFIDQIVVPAAENAGIKAEAIPALLDGFSTGTFANVPGLTPQIQETVTIAYQTAFSKAVRIVYLISIAFGVLAIGGALVSPNPDSRFTTQVARRMHGKENTMAEEKEAV